MTTIFLKYDAQYKHKGMKHYLIGKPGDIISGGIYIKDNEEIPKEIILSFDKINTENIVADNIDVGD